MKDSDRVEAWEIARGICVACRYPLGDSGVVHHRKGKGMGGRRRTAGFDSPPNTVVLHDACHKAVHANPAAARDAGLIVSNWSDPAEIPMTRLSLS